MEERAKYTVDTIEAPPQFEWLPIGTYNGTDLPNTMVDQDYVVWVEVTNPECNCEVIIQ